MKCGSTAKKANKRSNKRAKTTAKLPLSDILCNTAAAAIENTRVNLVTKKTELIEKLSLLIRRDQESQANGPAITVRSSDDMLNPDAFQEAVAYKSIVNNMGNSDISNVKVNWMAYKIGESMEKPIQDAIKSNPRTTDGRKLERKVVVSRVYRLYYGPAFKNNDRLVDGLRSHAEGVKWFVQRAGLYVLRLPEALKTFLV